MKKIIDTSCFKEFYTLQETAKIFNVNERTIRRWIENTELQAIKLGHTVRISREEINRIKGL